MRIFNWEITITKVTGKYGRKKAIKKIQKMGLLNEGELKDRGDNPARKYYYNRIPAIKEYRNLTGALLKEAKDIIEEEYVKRYGRQDWL